MSMRIRRLLHGVTQKLTHIPAHALFSRMLTRLLSAWLFAALTESVLFVCAYGASMDAPLLADLSAPAAMSLARLVLITLLVFVMLTVLDLRLSGRVFSRILSLLPAGLFALLSALWLAVSFAWGLFAAALLIEIILLTFALFGRDVRAEDAGTLPQNAARPAAPEKHARLYGWLTGILAVLVFAFLSVWTVSRIYTFSTPSYDLGIFAQMFHHMKRSGLPLTTIERDGLLSHFAVHVSPVYYLMLPVYMLFPYAETLQILYALVMALAVHPLWKLAKLHGLSAPLRALACAALLLYPVFSGAASFDLHENGFLTLFLLWLLYYIDKNRVIPAAVFALLTLSVKEDAAMYVGVIGLWLMIRAMANPGPDAEAPAAAAPAGRRVANPFRHLKDMPFKRKRLLLGLGLFVTAVGYFLWVTAWLQRAGDGVMTGRFDNLIYDGSGSLFAVVKVVFLCPFKVLFECTDPDKLPYIAYSLGLLAGLPLITRRYERYLLLIPFALMHLVPDYVYMHRLFFHYAYGTTALLFYLVIVNLADIRPRLLRSGALCVTAALCAVWFCLTVIPKAMYYPQRYVRNRAYFTAVCEKLDVVPDYASVACSTFYAVRLADHDVLYDIKYCSTEHLLSCDWVVLNRVEKNSYKKYADKGQENGADNLIRLLEDNGYRQAVDPLDDMLIFRRPGLTVIDPAKP